MSKKVFDQIAEGLQEALAVVRGEEACKFPPRPVSKMVTATETAEDTHKRFPRIIAELAKE